MAVNSRDKGATFERKIAKMFSDTTREKFIRQSNSGAVGTVHEITELQGDVYCPTRQCAYIIECKKYKEIKLESLLTAPMSDIVKWFDKLDEQKGKYNGCLIFQQNYGKILCAVENWVTKSSNLVYRSKAGNNYTIMLFDNWIKEVGGRIWA